PAKAGIMHRTIEASIIKGLIKRKRTGLTLTELGCATTNALLGATCRSRITQFDTPAACPSARLRRTHHALLARWGSRHPIGDRYSGAIADQRQDIVP